MMRKLAEQVIRKIAENEALDRITTPAVAWVNERTASTDVRNALSGTWLGHPLHPALTDIPIGAWVAATALDLTGGKRSARAARQLVALGVLAAAPAAATGASDWAHTFGATQRVGLSHAVANTVGTGLQATSWMARRRGRRGLGVLLSFAGLGVTLGAAYLGGYLTLVRATGVNHTAFESGPSGWTDVAAESDVAEGKLLRVEAAGVPVVLAKHQGTITALSATCTHAGGPLDEGSVDEGCITCPWHGSQFHVEDGSVERGPAAVPEPVWEVKVADGRVSVRMTS